MCALCTFIVPIVHQVHFNCKSEFLIFFFYFDVSHAWGFAEIEKVNLYYLYEVRRYTSWLVNNWDGALFIFKSDLIILESPTSSLHFFFTNCSESVVDIKVFNGKHNGLAQISALVESVLSAVVNSWKEFFTKR